MQAIYLILLLIVYAMAIEGFIDLFSALGTDLSNIQVSFLLSMLGVGLGFLFYGLSQLNQTIKRDILLGVPGVILLIVVSTYFIFGVFALYDLIIVLAKITFSLIMSSTPLFGMYGLLKRQKNTILATGFGILFFLFFAKVILLKFTFSSETIGLVILFFILFVCHLEFGISSIYFGDVLHKMMPNNNADESMLLRFNYVLNRYLINIFIVLAICYGASLAILQYSSPLISITGGEILSIKFGSVYGMWLLVGITVICAFLFWFLIPREKTKKVQ